MASMRRLLSIPPATHEQGWWPTPRWALRRLAMYAIAAVSGGALFVIYAALLTFFSPQEPPARPTIPTESAPRTAPPKAVIEKSPLIASAAERAKLIKIAWLIENKGNYPNVMTQFVSQAGLEQKYPLGFALFYTDGKKILYDGRPSSNGISFDASTLKVTRIGNTYCMNILPVRISGKLLENVTNNCFGGQGIVRVAIIGDVAVEIDPLASSSEGSAWVIGLRPAHG